MKGFMNMTDTGEDGDPEQGEQAMIVVGICDGEQTVRSLIAGFVEQYHAETGVELRLLSYNTGEKLLKNYMLDMDLIFLEIPFRNISALKIAEHIKRQDSQVRIVFLTTVLSYVLEAYEAGASSYLLKPLSYAKFCRELSHVREEKDSFESLSFLEENKKGLYKIYLHQILYIETCGRKTMIHTGREDIPSNKQMKQHEQLLSGLSFARCHAGYIVNLRYFQKLEGSILRLTNGAEIPVSRRRRKQVLTQVTSLYGEGGMK